MTNLTISLDEEIIREARVRAIREGTSISAKVREFLQQYALPQSQQQQAAQAIVALARQSPGGSGGSKFDRDELYDRPYPGGEAS